jgi:hypothetical protein
MERRQEELASHEIIFKIDLKVQTKKTTPSAADSFAVRLWVGALRLQARKLTRLAFCAGIPSSL